MIAPGTLLAVARTIRSLAAAGHLARALAARDGWRFDLPSAVIGLLVGVGLAVAVYALRGRISAGRTAITTGATTVRRQLSKGVEERYRERLIRVAQSAHLLHRYLPLSDVYVPHRLVIPHANPLSERLHDAGAKDERWRQICLDDLLHHAQSTVELRDALAQSAHLAVLGPMGSGRSTLVAYLAWLFASREGWRLTYDEPQETDALEVIEGRDREQARLPVWIALESVNLDLIGQEGPGALLEPITEYLASTLPRLIARPSASLIQGQIAQGNVFLLLDNLDALDGEAQVVVLDWLQDLLRTYPENHVLIAGAPQGYDRLWQRGIAPLMLDGFRQAQVTEFVGRWAQERDRVELDAWRQEVEAARVEYDREVARARREGRPPAEAEFVPPPAPERPPGLLHMWQAGNHDRVMPLDLALAALLWREQDRVPQAALMRHAQTLLLALDRIEDSSLSSPQWARILSQAAWHMQLEDRHYARRADLYEPIGRVLAPTIEVDPQETDEQRQAEKQQAEMERQARAALDALISKGDLLMDVGRGRVAFVHPSFGMYLAAQYAARNDQAEVMTAHVRDPRWEGVLLFYAALAKVAPLVVARLKGADDLFRSNFFAAAGYLSASTQVDPRLRGGVLAELAQVFLDGRQPAMLRQRAVAALADTGDKGTVYLFGQSLRNEDPHVRRLGVWGLARLGDESLLDGVMHALSDRDVIVRIDALFALGSLGGQGVIDGLIQGLQDEDELVRRVAAEMMAAVGGEGWELLRQAADSDDMYIRRVAVWGLSAVRQSWAVETIQRLALEDGEWYVRSAATEALDQLTAGEASISPPPLRLQDQPWLVDWVAQQGLALAPQDALATLARAVQEGNWQVKLSAADALRVAGGADVIPALLTALDDDDVLVREAVYTALSEIHVRTGARIARPRG